MKNSATIWPATSLQGTDRAITHYDEDGIVIIQGDARSLPLGDGSVDCIVTSPPYNVGMDYDGIGDTFSPDEYVSHARGWAYEMFRVLRDNRRLWLNVVPSATYDDHERPAGWHSGRTKAPRFPLLDVWQGVLQQSGFNLVDIVAWTRVGNNSTAWGSYQSPASPNLRGDWEAIILACKGEYARATPDEWKGWKDDYGPWTPLVSTHWQFAPAPRNGHPAPFPLELPRRCIRLSTWPGETVLDPFAGSGTTLRAAYELGRKAIGQELSKSYCDLAAQRLAQGVLEFG